MDDIKVYEVYLSFNRKRPQWTFDSFEHAREYCEDSLQQVKDAYGENTTLYIVLTVRVNLGEVC